MVVEGQGDLFDPNRTDYEGEYDPQLFLPMPDLGAEAPFRTIVKRDGHEELFDRQKIAAAIRKAAVEAGGEDLDMADNLAAAVMIYLQKRRGAAPPTVDHVHDAVERVLLHMAHGKTALAYARHRERRTRIRRLREGDMRGFLSELEEARHAREALGGRPDGLLEVRGSGGTVTQWDRERIVEALVRETGLERNIAAMVALDVEQQLDAAPINTLTTALVRELVDAKLVEHGLGEHGEHHRRLGVPLFDTKRIIHGTVPETAGENPAGTDAVLARAVKREYALSEVFPAPVTQAHLRGDIHLHGLGLVDRLHGAVHSPGHLLAHGLGRRGEVAYAPPPARPDLLLAHMAKATRLFEEYFAEPAAWDAVNFFFAPFLKGMGKEEIDMFAQMTVYEFAFPAIQHGGAPRPVELHLHWTPPPQLAEPFVLLPREASEHRYGDFTPAAQQFAWSLLEVLREGGGDGAAYPAPLPCIHLGPNFFSSPGHAEFLDQVAALAAAGRPLAVAFERAPSHADPSAAWHPREVALHAVSLNLPRAAFEAGTAPRLIMRLERLLNTAIQAHQAKHDFLVRLTGAAGDGPLGALVRTYGGRPYLDLEAGACLVCIEGLNEAVRALLHKDMHEDEEAGALAERIVASLARRCAELGARRGLRLVPAANNSTAASTRFAGLDAQAHPEAVRTALAPEAVAPKTLQYTTGGRLAPRHQLSPVEAVRMAGRLHQHLAAGAQTDITLPLAHTSAAVVADFLRKAYRETAVKRIVFV